MLSIFFRHVRRGLTGDIPDDGVPDFLGNTIQFVGAVVQDVCINCTELGMFLLVTVEQVHNQLGDFILTDAFLAFCLGGSESQNV